MTPTIITHSGFGQAFLPPSEASRFRYLIHSLLLEYSRLVNFAVAGGALLWAMVPKHHWLWHLGDRATLLNPRRGNCMIDEDYVGAVKEVVRSAAHGCPSHKIAERVAEKMQWGRYITIVYGR